MECSTWLAPSGNDHVAGSEERNAADDQKSFHACKYNKAATIGQPAALSHGRDVRLVGPIGEPGRGLYDEKDPLLPEHYVLDTPLNLALTPPGRHCLG